MPLHRILVAFSGLRSVSAALDCLRRAQRSAGSPSGLRFALPKRLEGDFSALAAKLDSAQPLNVFFYGERSGLSAIAAAITNETHLLFLMGEYGFEDKWDQTLLNRLAKVPERNALLTATMGNASTDVQPQPYLPALAENFEENGVLIQQGLPLVCSAAPVQTLVADPALLFSRVAFLSQMDLRLDGLSIAAYRSGVPVYALDRAALWPLHPLPERRLQRPVADSLPGTTLARFEQLAGFRYEQKRAGIRTNWGLFATEDTYPQQLPTRLAVSQRARALLGRSKKLPPLLTSAFIDLPHPRKPLPVYLIRFEYLMALRSLPLHLYTGGSQERMLRAIFPNARSYPDLRLLPKALLNQGMDTEVWMQRNKLLLMARTAVEHPDFTHVAWVNADMLKHPICPDAAPDFSPLMDDRVHLATVNAVPDLSFLITPVRHLNLLCRAVKDLTLLDVELKRSLTEVSLFERLYQKFPDLFALHPMPKKHLLFLTAFDPELLDQRYQFLLKNLKPVVKAEPQS